MVTSSFSRVLDTRNEACEDELQHLLRRGIDPPHSAHVPVHYLWVEARRGVARRSLSVEVECTLPLGFFYVFRLLNPGHAQRRGHLRWRQPCPYRASLLLLPR